MNEDTPGQVTKKAGSKRAANSVLYVVTAPERTALWKAAAAREGLSLKHWVESSLDERMAHPHQKLESRVDELEQRIHDLRMQVLALQERR